MNASPFFLCVRELLSMQHSELIQLSSIYKTFLTSRSRSYGWVVADCLAGEIDLSNTTFLKFCHTLVGNWEICVARSLFEVICVREGELYIADIGLKIVFQLSEVNEIISALCTVDI